MNSSCESDLRSQVFQLLGDQQTLLGEIEELRVQLGNFKHMVADYESKANLNASTSSCWRWTQRYLSVRCTRPSPRSPTCSRSRRAGRDPGEPAADIQEGHDRGQKSSRLRKQGQNNLNLVLVSNFMLNNLILNLETEVNTTGTDYNRNTKGVTKGQRPRNQANHSRHIMVGCRLTCQSCQTPPGSKGGVGSQRDHLGDFYWVG